MDKPKIGETFWYAPENGWPKEAVLTGETSRSYLIGQWFPEDLKVPKKGITILTEAEYELHEWANKHRYHISQCIDNRHKVSAEKVRQIADLIGYKEEPKNA